MEEVWVYEHRGRKHATIHLGTCFYCNHGKGKHQMVAGRGGQWNGPFFSLDEAMAFAEGLGLPVRMCRRCLPE